MAEGSPAPSAPDEPHINPMYDEDMDGVVDDAMRVRGLEPSEISQGIPVTDETLTFAEVDVVLGHGNTSVVDEGVQLSDERGWNYDWGDWDSIFNSEDGVNRQFNFVPKQPLTGAGWDCGGGSYQTGGITTNVTITEVATGTQVASVSGTSRTLVATGLTLTEGTEYRMNYTINAGERMMRNCTYPNDFGTVTITSGDDSMYGEAALFRGPPGGGNVNIDWSNSQSYISNWDIVTFQTEGVDANNPLTVDVQTNDGSGWTTAQSDISPNTSIRDVPPDSDVRLRAHLSRVDHNANGPRIVYAARRFSR